MQMGFNEARSLGETTEAVRVGGKEERCQACSLEDATVSEPGRWAGTSGKDREEVSEIRREHHVPKAKEGGKGFQKRGNGLLCQMVLLGQVG